MDKEKQHEYWKERNEQLYLNGEKKGLELAQALQKNYKQTIRNIQAEIYKLYGRYAKEGQIDLAETKKLLNKSELKTFKESTEDIAEYVKKTNDEDYKKKLKMLRIKSQVTRLEELKTNIEYELSKLTHKAEEQLREYLEEIYEDSYYRTIFNVEQNIGFAVSYTKPNQKLIEKAVSKQYQGVNYSTAIWNSKYTLFKILEQKIPQGLSAGWNPKKLAQIVDKQLNTRYNNTVRLIRTEYNLLMNEATADGYKTCGIEQYQILATLDNRTSEICQEMDLKVFDLKDKEAGINYPPFHYNCRTTTIPYFEPDEIDKEFGIGTRIARDENGKTYEVPADMNYKEWYKKYVSKEEGIVDRTLKKNTPLKDITNQKTNIINEAFRNENIKKIALNADIKSIKTGGNKAYHKNGNIVLKENYDRRTLIHEIGHTVDYNNKWLSHFKEFREAVQLDKKNVLNNLDVYKKMIKDNANYRELSDIIGGITNNKVVGRYKHEDKYWKEVDKLEKEIFAQMFTMAGNNDIKQLELFQRYLPNIFIEFDNLIRGLL